MAALSWYCDKIGFMNDLKKKLELFKTLLKGKALSFKAGQNLSSPNKPKVPGVETPKAPTVDKVSTSQASKKDPKKVAEQIADPDTKEKVMKEAIKLSKRGQWSLEKGDDWHEDKYGMKWKKGFEPSYSTPVKVVDNRQTAEPKKNEPHYHITVNGEKITDKPLSLTTINERHGGIKNIESIEGHRAVRAPAPKN